MKRFTYLISILPVLILFSSCEFFVNEPPQKQGTSVNFSLDGKINKFPGKGWWNHNQVPLKGRTERNIKDLLKGQQFDELKVLCLDMTQWSDWNEFLEAWNSTYQYALIDFSLWDFNRDDWDNINLLLQSYTGDFFEVAGDYTFSISDSAARGTVYLNPGLNYFFYAIRENGETFYYNEAFAIVEEDTSNTVHLVYNELNNDPLPPDLPFPPDLASGLPPNVILSWECLDPDGDILTYDVYFGTSTTDLIASDLTFPEFQVNNLAPFTTYYWYVVAYDPNGGYSFGPLWSFTTQ